VWVKKVFGVYGEEAKKVEEKMEWPTKWPKGVRVTPRIGRLPAWAKEQQEKAKESGHQHKEHRHGRHGHHAHGHGHGHGHGNLRKLIRAVKEVQAVNKKLSTFEQSFLSDDGIPDREW
jgi:hypothetical protein